MYENPALIPLIRFTHTRTQERGEMCLPFFWVYSKHSSQPQHLREKPPLAQLRCKNHDPLQQDFSNSFTKWAEHVTTVTHVT